MSINLIDKLLLLNVIGKALSSSRMRATYNFHKSYEERTQRLLNAIGVDSYIRPHRHLLDPKNECLLAVVGLFALIHFDDSGNVLNISKFGTEKYLDTLEIGVGIEIAPHRWHTVIALTQGAILFEVKEGPFYPDLAKEYPAWAPAEGSAESGAYLKFLRGICS
jgi:cupin fold WbuC family metalloprotein